MVANANCMNELHGMHVRYLKLLSLFTYLFIHSKCMSIYYSNDNKSREVRILFEPLAFFIHKNYLTNSNRHYCEENYGILTKRR